MNSSFNSDVPGWDGNPSTFLAFEVACKWFEKTLKETERRGAAARVWSRLSGPARSVVKHLSAEDFDCAGGLDKLLQVLRASPLQSLPIPDSFAKLEKWHQLRRRDQESIPELLVREDELFLELQQSLVRSRARERPATTLTGSPGAGATTGDGASTPASPSSAKKKEDDAEDEPATAETPAKDTGFFDNELRGFRLLKAAGITYAERQQVLTLTGNSVAFEKIRQALRALFDESEPSLRRAKPRNYWLPMARPTTSSTTTSAPTARSTTSSTATCAPTARSTASSSTNWAPRARSTWAPMACPTMCLEGRHRCHRKPRTRPRVCRASACHVR